MYVYTDVLTGDELLNDTFPRQELVNGMIWQVEGKLVPKYTEVNVNTGGNPSIQELHKKNQKRAKHRESKHGTTSSERKEENEKKVVDVVDHFGLVELKNLSFKKKEFVAHIKKFIKQISPELDEQQKIFLRENMPEATDFLLSKLEDLQFFVGSSQDEKSQLVFAYYEEEQSESPTFLYLSVGLKKVKC